jgi:uncharacterized Zn-binding protein involved in type VI secretion
MDFHACPIVKGMVPDVGGLVMLGSPTVLINSMMACRVGDLVAEIPGGPNPIMMGATNVCIGDAGTVSPGAPGVAAQALAPSLAAMPDAAAAQAQTLIEAAKGGVPFCEKCQHVTDGQTASTSDPNQTAGETKSDASGASAASKAAEQQFPLSAFVHDEFGIPQEGVLVEVTFDDGRTERAQTNSVGNFVVMMKKPHESAKVRYTIPGKETVETTLREDFFIEMPGTDSDDGLRRRLYNLGYLDDDDLSAAVIAFQATHGFPTTGEADQETRDKLTAVHDGDDPIVPVIDVDSGPLSEDELMAEGDQLL